MTWAEAREWTLPQALELIRAEARAAQEADARQGLVVMEAVLGAVAPLASKKNQPLAQKIRDGFRRMLGG